MAGMLVCDVPTPPEFFTESMPVNDGERKQGSGYKIDH